MKSILSFLFLIICISGLAQSADTLKRIDQLFSQWNNATPGVAVAIQRGDQIIYSKAFGLTDLEHNVPNTTETIFESGSVAKQFTAFSILLLAADGKLSLTDDIRKYVPEIPAYNKTITIQLLLNHTSGLKDWGSIGGIAGWPRTTRVYTQDLALQIMSKQKSTNFLPGNEYSYSNANYSLLVTIVERVSGKSLQDFTDEKIFKPLGMNSTKWRNNFHELIRNRAIAYSKTKEGYEQLMPFEDIHGHGGLLTTTADLLKWNSLLENKKIGGDKVYQWRVQKGKLNNGQEITYAAGLMVDQLNGFKEISHSGSTAGYRAWLAYYPEKKLSVVLLSNAGNFSVGVGREIASVFLGKAENKKAIDRPIISLSEPESKKFDGIYRSVRHFEIQKLEFNNGKIISNDRELNASHKDTLFLDNMKWVYKKSGIIQLINRGDTMTYKKVSPAESSTFSSLAGEYKSEEADATYTVTVKNNEVWVQIKPFAPSKLEPKFKDGFLYEGYDLFEFIRDKKQKVIGLNVSTGRAEKVPFPKIN